MVLHFNVTGESRKAMVKAIEEEMGTKAKYLGAPSMAYQVGNYRILRDGTLEIESECIDMDGKVVDACVMATGMNPTEWDEVEEETNLTISVPRAGFTDEAIGNLYKILESKGQLFSHAFGREDLIIVTGPDKIMFPWFYDVEPEKVPTYTRFIEAICNMAKTQKRITAKPREDENEKYAFRCFLLRLGFIGDEYKADRKILLEKLDGSSAFKTKKGEE